MQIGVHANRDPPSSAGVQKRPGFSLHDISCTTNLRLNL
jgi:hypothetical protein